MWIVSVTRYNPQNPKQPKLLMQSYYRLRLISMKGCHLLLSNKLFSTCRTYHTPHKNTQKSVLMVEVEGVAPSSSIPIAFIVNKQFYVCVPGLFRSKLLYIIQVSLPVGDVIADTVSVLSLFTKYVTK